MYRFVVIFPRTGECVPVPGTEGTRVQFTLIELRSWASKQCGLPINAYLGHIAARLREIGRELLRVVDASPPWVDDMGWIDKERALQHLPRLSGYRRPTRDDLVSDATMYIVELGETAGIAPPVEITLLESPVRDHYVCYWYGTFGPCFVPIAEFIERTVRPRDAVGNPYLYLVKEEEG